MSSLFFFFPPFLHVTANFSGGLRGEKEPWKCLWDIIALKYYA